MNSGRPSKQKRVEWSAWVILRYSFNPRLLFKVRTSFQLVLGWMKYQNSTDRVYQIFLTLLIFDLFWGFPRLFIHKIDQLTSSFPLNSSSPTPHLASVMCIRNRGHLDVDDLSNMLLNNVHPEGGFVSFHDQPQADLLSTAVAAYALSQSPAGYSQLAANGLGFVSSNFDRGAFLSGNGDPSRDVEYTFYGLLALSAYAQSLTETQESS
ncbi:MAG: hypothetical protein PHY99_08550 [Bacteroidales bacterium]|nr:hypothetical protein [Bacteroidales bacterium]